ncbi:DsrE family protein [Salinarimonas sp.]|uniref:DsrE family protein n=1 Tax=Salinarimonas sp. TaxID=2766526 RepID=UPI0032D99066
MTTIRAIAAAIVAAFLVLAGPGLAQDARYGEQKVVYHINFDGGEAARPYMTALGNVRNHINAVGRENITARVVLHGDGVHLLRDARDNPDLQQRVLDMRAQGVKFLVCRNTLTGRDIDYEWDLFEVFEEDIVPSGVAELSHLQQQGYTYVRP